MSLNPADFLNPIVKAIDALIESEGVYRYLAFVWLALALIGWIFSGGLRKRLKGHSSTAIPIVIVTMQPPRQSPPPIIDIGVDQTWDDEHETTD